MPRIIEEPVTVKEERGYRQDGTRTTHPAFAQIGAHRISGRANLHGSDFSHNHYVVIRVRRSELNRDLNRDWHYARDEYIEVALSESQWATFVSSLNMGDGTPCTLTALNGKMVPGLPDPKSRADQFADELEGRLGKMADRIRKQIAEIDDMGLPKGKAAILKSGLERTLTDLVANLPFVAKQFDEHMEEVVESGKQEIHGYMTSHLQRAGLMALNGGSLPLQLEDQSGNDVAFDDDYDAHLTEQMAEDDADVQAILDHARNAKV